MKLIAESYNEYNAEYNLITEGILDNIRNSINLTDKRKWLKYAVIAYLSALGIKDYNDAELQSQLNKAIHQEITVFDIKQIANIISNAADKAESLFNNYNKSNDNISISNKQNNNIQYKYYYLPHDLNKPIQISNNLKNFIKEKESLDLRAHYVKINKKGKIGREDFLTIGWGHKLPKNTKLKQGDKITLEQAQKFFDDDINNIVGKGLMMRLRELKEAGVEIEKIPQHVIDIMGDIIYNGGSSGLRNTDFFKTLMLGDFYKAGKLLPKTQITAKGHVQPGLVKRAKERELQYFKNFNKELNMWVKP